ncbi:AI-2 transport protein TqsA [Paraliobacillus sp. PM-2]|uniref:sporulation integral membrane protein YtvI n=1 Tax=Paraliobacillus sp. PM-2 TaxID=1462524 RepID=UPI00061C7883|nr:sporulation integral membrane protein YtvI [Paraliobacillus sp. PM-2]CQR47817.1 AI-2 transport protein TqsA [Paraliobacillus sp. PM-2]
MFRYLTKRHWLFIFLAIVLLLIGYFILPVSLPLIFAFFTTLFLNPSIRWLQFRFKLNRKISVIVVFLIFVLITGVLGTYVVASAVTHIVNFVENAPTYINQIMDKFVEWQAELENMMKDLPVEFIKEIRDGIDKNIVNISNSIKSQLQVEKIAGMVAAIPEYLVSLLVYLIALFLFMIELPTLKAKFYQYLTDTTAEKVQFMNARLSYVVLGFLKAQFLVSIIIFIVTLIGLLLIVPEYAIIMSLIIWLVDFIPIIGSIAILAPWSLYMYITGDVIMGTKLAVLAIMLLAIRRTVEPKVMGQHIGLSPLATLIAMYIGLQLLGLLGFIVGPLVVIGFNSAKEAGIIKWNFKL